MQIHRATVRWARGEHAPSDERYPTGHMWEFDGGARVPASASPHVMDPPRSVPENVDPEEALVAAASSCHMLFYLYFAERAGFPVESYSDAAEGVMERDGDGKTAITVIRLKPTITYAGPAPDDRTVASLHEKSHDHCFIANSLKARIEIVSDA